MKKLFTLIFLLATYFGFAQEEPKRLSESGFYKAIFGIHPLQDSLFSKDGNVVIEGYTIVKQDSLEH